MKNDKNDGQPDLPLYHDTVLILLFSFTMGLEQCVHINLNNKTRDESSQFGLTT